MRIKVLKIFAALALSLILADLGEYAYVHRESTLADCVNWKTTVKESIKTDWRPYTTRAATFYVIETISRETGIPPKTAVRVYHFALLFLIFLTVFIFLGVNSLWAYIINILFLYGFYLRDMQFLARLSDWSAILSLSLLFGFTTYAVLKKTEKVFVIPELIFLFFTSMFAYFFRENAALIIVFMFCVICITGIYALSDHKKDPSHIILNVTLKRMLLFSIVTAIGLLAGRFLIEFVFPGAYERPWWPHNGATTGSLAFDISIYFPINIGWRRNIIFDLCKQFGVFFIMALLLLRTGHNREERAVVISSLITLFAYLGMYVIIGNLNGETFCIMSMLLGMYIPLGILLKRKWNLTIVGENDNGK